MSKVTLTQDQANQIEHFLNEEPVWSKEKLITHASKEGFLAPHAKCLNELEVGELAEAIYEGYEIEPQFEVGDVVLKISGSEFISGDTISEIDDIGSGENKYRIKRGAYVYGEEIRHATGLEKQFYALGRTKPKLRVGDFIIHNGIDRSFVGYSTGFLTANKWLEEGSVDYIYPVENCIKVEKEDE